MPPRPPQTHHPKKKPASRVRGLAIDVLGEWAHGDRYASDILDQAQREVDLIAPDAAFLREIVLTTLRNLSLLDHWITVLTEDKTYSATTMPGNYRLLYARGISTYTPQATAYYSSPTDNYADGYRYLGACVTAP